MSSASAGPPSPPWVAGLNERAKPRVGRRLALLALTMPQWILRRVETLELHDDTTARRLVSIDFHLPREITPLHRFTTMAVTFVPLTYVTKGPLRNFDLRDENGAAMSLLTRRENGELAAAALAYLAELELGHPVEDEILDDIEALTYASEDAADDLLVRLFRQAGAARTSRFRLQQSTAFRGLAQRLAGAFLLITPVTGNRKRRIVKFAFDETIVSSRGAFQRFAQSLSWQPTRTIVEVPGIVNAGSFHLEAHAPLELTLTYASLFSPTTGRLLTEDRGPRSRLHLLTEPQADEARALLRFMAPRRGIIRASFLTTCFAVAVLTVGAFRLSQLVEAKDGVATVLVAVPALVAGYMARPGEHALASRLLLGVRTCVLVSGAASFAASAVLLAGPGGAARTAIWWSLDGVAALMALLLLVSLMRSRKP